MKVLVTGSSRGLGAEIIKVFAVNGVDVIINYNHSEKEAYKLADSITNVNVEVIKCDISNEDEVKAMFNRIDHLDYLINNAAISDDKDLKDKSALEFNRILHTNLTGTFLVTKYAIDKMDKGLDSEVGEGGDMLSTGEKQLISFARAILADPKILVLDEATASIDTLTEKAIQDAIFTVIKGRTSFVIAHRLSTIVDADVILVVKDGKIIERGKHAELMHAHGYYYDLYTRQYEEMVTNTVSEIA